MKANLRLTKIKFSTKGMDEVFYGCWESSPEIANFMKGRGMTRVHQLEEFYVRQTLANAKSVGYNYMMWQDPVDNGVKVSSN